MTPQRLRVALVGAGKIGKVHLQSIYGLARKYELVATIDPNAGRINGVPHFSHILELEKLTKQPDLLVIATPNGLHFDHAKQAIELGTHVLVEKPITLKSDEAKSLSKLTNKRLFSTMQLRLSPVVQWLKSILVEGNLGQVYMVNAQCNWNRTDLYYQNRSWHGTKDLDGGVLFTQFSHFVDVLHFLFKELVIEQSKQFNFNHQRSTEFPDSGKIDFVTEEGAMGNFIYTTSTYQKNFESFITIIGENGTVKIGDQYLNQVLYCNVEGLPSIPNFGSERNFHPDVYHEVHRAITANKPSVLDAEDSINSIAFMEQANQQ